MREADLEQLYARLERPLYNVVFRWVWKPAEAQDIVQEAFVRLWRMRGRVDLATVEPLVYRIALNLASTRARSRKIWRWVPIETLRETLSTKRTAEETMSANQDRARLRAAVDSLPEELRDVVMLCEFSELSYGEIAKVLSIPVGTVGSRRNRALRRLKLVLSNDREDHERPLRETV